MILLVNKAVNLCLNISKAQYSILINPPAAVFNECFSTIMSCDRNVTMMWKRVQGDLTLKRPGGVESTPPLNIFRDNAAARNFFTAPLDDFLL